MSSIPSFLGKAGVKEISHRIFTDLQLDSLLSPTARKILSFPCNGEEITRRQEFFHIISSDSSKLDTVKEAISALNLYQAAFGVWDASSVPAEKCYLFIKLLDETGKLKVNNK